MKFFLYIISIYLNLVRENIQNCAFPLFFQSQLSNFHDITDLASFLKNIYLHVSCAHMAWQAIAWPWVCTCFCAISAYNH